MWVCHPGATKVPTTQVLNTISLLETTPHKETWESDIHPALCVFVRVSACARVCVRACVRACVCACVLVRVILEH